jgi:hypothetical protein
MNPGDTFLSTHKIAGRPDIATVVHEAGFLVKMEGKIKNKRITWYEHVAKFKNRWRQQLSLFEVKTESKLSKKHLK